MIRRTIVPLLAFAAVVSTTAWAQSPTAEDAAQQVMQQIHDELTAKGFTDVHIVPSSFIVSGTNQEGQRVMILIGPNSMTVMTPGEPGDALQPPEQAQHKDKSLQEWE
jgi:hypothetical protein